jgi:PAS domain S-box-containing protein
MQQIPENSRHRSAEKAVFAVAFGAIFAGTLVIIGWAVSIEALKALIPGLPRMSVSTALCFSLAGVSLLSVTGPWGRETLLKTLIAWAAVLAVFTVALVRFSQTIFPWHFHILPGLCSALASNSGGRMASQTAVGFLLLSFSLLLVHSPRQKYPAAIALLGITITSLGTSSLISYAAGFNPMAGGAGPGMAVHTAGIFLVFGLALMAEAWRESGQNWFLSRRLTSAFALSGILILSLSIVGYKITTQQSEENARLSEQLEAQAHFGGTAVRSHDLSRETMAELRHVIFAGVTAGLVLFAGVLWLLNREVAERRTAEAIFRNTERKAAEALRESEERFRQMAENIENVFWMCNPELTTFLYVSPACEKVWGVSAPDLYANGLCFIKKIHPADRERVSVQLGLKQFVQKAGFDIEYRVTTDKGAVRWVRHRAFPIRSDAGDLKRLVGVAEDITERKEAEEASYFSQERFRSVWERSADGMRLTDENGCIIAVNEAYCRLVKLPREKLEGNPFSVAYNGHGPKDGMDTYIRRFESGDVVPRLEARCQLWNTEHVDLEISNSFLELGSRGRLLLSIFRDVGERRRLEGQLRQAQKMEAVGSLAGGVAHDFNNLLVVMRTHAELLLLDNAVRTDEARDGLRQITDAADKAANLTRQLLAFSRKQVMQSQPLLVNDIVANLTKMLNRIIGEDIRLECHYVGGLPSVQADAGMLEQVIVNLVINARDAMPGGGQVQIGTEKVVLDATCTRSNPEARPGEFVCLSVTDTGTGIAPEHLPRIFEPFFTTKEMGKGTGLGLATVYGIVKQHGGWIEVETRIATGTTFKVFLPALPVENRQSDDQPRPPRICTGTESILLVEDEDAVREVLKESLETYGYKIFEASCAREAMKMWKKNNGKIDLLLTDIVMPEGMNGRDLAERIRATKPDLSVIFMSGYSPEIAGKDTGFFRKNKTAFLQKPFPATALLETVRRCVDEKELPEN